MTQATASATWRLLIDEHAARGAVNMAVDTALLESAQQNRTQTLRLYRWDPACLSFGRNQTTAGVYDVDRLRDAGIDVVRRPTGGLAVLHDQELTYSVASPAHLLGGPRAAYATINQALVEGLRLLGVAAALADASQRAPSPHGTNPCFQAPAAGEVMAAGDKLVGSAQRCENRTLLQHGSILLDGRQSDIVAFQHVSARAQSGAPAPSIAPDPSDGITLRSILGRVPDHQVLVEAIVLGFESVMGTRLAPGVLTKTEQARALELQRQYDSDEWTWRR